MTRLRFLLEKRATEEQMKRLKAVELVSFLPMEAVSETGELDLSREKPQEEVSTGYTQFFDGDVLVARITPCFENGKGAVAQGLKNGIGYGSTEFHVLRSGKDLNPKFLYYITQSSDFRKLGEASMTGAAGQKRVTDEFIQNFEVDIPEADVQSRICEYLDKALTDLRELISAKQRLLETLAEKRRALITHAVTQGLDPKVPMKDSGIPWLGKIPAHWELNRAKVLFKEIDERSTEGEEVLLSLRMGKGLVPHNDVSEKVILPSELVGYKKAAIGQLVINRMRAASGLIAIVPQPGLVSPDYAVFEPIKAMELSYYTELFQTPLLQSLFRSESKGLGTGESGFLRLYSENFLSIHLPVPPIDEQIKITAWAKRETNKIDALASATERAILILQERRSALISAAVTGQMEVS